MENLREQLLKVNSKANCKVILKWVGTNPDRYKELIDLFLENEYRISQRAAMVVGDLHRVYPFMIIPYLPRVVKNLRNASITDAVKRNSVRILQEIDVPDDLQGDVLDICFTWLADPKMPVAVRAFSMTVCWNICQKIPELMPELRMTIEDWIDQGTPGFKSRGNKILKAMTAYEQRKN